QIILGKVRPFLRRLAEAHPQVLIIARINSRRGVSAGVLARSREAEFMEAALVTHPLSHGISQPPSRSRDTPKGLGAAHRGVHGSKIRDPIGVGFEFLCKILRLGDGPTSVPCTDHACAGLATQDQRPPLGTVPRTAAIRLRRVWRTRTRSPTAGEAPSRQ
ncbi:hypothetical protein BST43_19650, partial [Mycobacteroides saopaulense]